MAVDVVTVAVDTAVAFAAVEVVEAVAVAVVVAAALVSYRLPCYCTVTHLKGQGQLCEDLPDQVFLRQSPDPLRKSPGSGGADQTARAPASF